jgi:hypothetical protein
MMKMSLLESEKLEEGLKRLETILQEKRWDRLEFGL